DPLSQSSQEEGVKLCQFHVRGDLVQDVPELRFVLALNLGVDQVPRLRAWKLPEQVPPPRLEKYRLVHKLNDPQFREPEPLHDNLQVFQGFDPEDHQTAKGWPPARPAGYPG